jgi:hypothetical protein
MPLITYFCFSSSLTSFENKWLISAPSISMYSGFNVLTCKDKKTLRVAKSKSTSSPSPSP